MNLCGQISKHLNASFYVLVYLFVLFKSQFWMYSQSLNSSHACRPQVVQLLQLCESHVGEEPQEETQRRQDALGQYHTTSFVPPEPFRKTLLNQQLVDSRKLTTFQLSAILFYAKVTKFLVNNGLIQNSQFMRNLELIDIRGGEELFQIFQEESINWI